jgi:hypothetical protein
MLYCYTLSEVIRVSGIYRVAGGPGLQAALGGITVVACQLSVLTVFAPSHEILGMGRVQMKDFSGRSEFVLHRAIATMCERD